MGSVSIHGMMAVNSIARVFCAAHDGKHGENRGVSILVYCCGALLLGASNIRCLKHNIAFPRKGNKKASRARELKEVQRLDGDREFTNNKCA